MNYKRIGIDARLYNQTGVGTYVRNLLHYLPQYSDNATQYYVYVLPQDKQYISLPSDIYTIRFVDAPWHSFAEQTTFYSLLMQDKLDLMHFTYFSYPIRYNRAFIATIHDITPLLFKTGQASTHNPIWYECKYQLFKYVLASQINNAKALITPTQSVAKQLEQTYGLHIAKKTQHIYEGINYELLQTKANHALSTTYRSPFYIYVGNFYPHKNVAKLVQAWKGNPALLILVGPNNMFSQQIEDMVRNQDIHSVTFFYDAQTSDLAWLYQNAQALINPSLSEGFGLPLIEAARFGCPIIASDIPVFKELLGSDYVSFDQTSVSDIRQKTRLRKKDLPQVPKTKLKRYRFETMTQQTLKVYENYI